MITVIYHNGFRQTYKGKINIKSDGFYVHIEADGLYRNPEFEFTWDWHVWDIVELSQIKEIIEEIL